MVHGCLRLLRLCLSSRLVRCLCRTSDTADGGVHLGGLVAGGSRSPEMPRGVRSCYLSCC